MKKGENWIRAFLGELFYAEFMAKLNKLAKEKDEKVNTGEGELL